MKQRLNRKQKQDNATNRISFRLDTPIAERFERVVAASKRSKTSVIEECLQATLPKLEKQYSAAA